MLSSPVVPNKSLRSGSVFACERSDGLLEVDPWRVAHEAAALLVAEHAVVGQREPDLGLVELRHDRPLAVLDLDLLHAHDLGNAEVQVRPL